MKDNINDMTIVMKQVKKWEGKDFSQVVKPMHEDLDCPNCQGCGCSTCGGSGKTYTV